MKVLNTRSTEGYLHLLAFKQSDVKKLWVCGLHTKRVDIVLKCVKDLVEVQLVQDELTMKRYHADVREN